MTSGDRRLDAIHRMARRVAACNTAEQVDRVLDTIQAGGGHRGDGEAAALAVIWWMKMTEDERALAHRKGWSWFVEFGGGDRLHDRPVNLNELS